MQQRGMQRTEPDAPTSELALHDDVGGVTEHLGSEHVADRAGDREHEDEPERDPHPAEHPTEPVQRPPEILRFLTGNTERVPAARWPVVGRREIDVVLLFVLAVDDGHAALFSPICDCTISA